MSRFNALDIAADPGVAGVPGPKGVGQIDVISGECVRRLGFAKGFAGTLADGTPAAKRPYNRNAAHEASRARGGFW
jgi:hypothetical protein